jgi:hypothetical protein
MKAKRLLVIALGVVAFGLAVSVYPIWRSSRTFCDLGHSELHDFIEKIQTDPPEVVERKKGEMTSCIRNGLRTMELPMAGKMAIDGLVKVVERSPQEEDQAVALYFEILDRRPRGFSLVLDDLPHLCRSRKNIESSIERVKVFLNEEKFAEEAERCLKQLEDLHSVPQPGN